MGRLWTRTPPLLLEGNFSSEDNQKDPKGRDILFLSSPTSVMVSGSWLLLELYPHLPSPSLPPRTQICLRTTWCVSIVTCDNSATSTSASCLLPFWESLLGLNPLVTQSPRPPFYFGLLCKPYFLSADTDPYNCSPSSTWIPESWG